MVLFTRQVFAHYDQVLSGLSENGLESGIPPIDLRYRTDIGGNPKCGNISKLLARNQRVVSPWFPQCRINERVGSSIWRVDGELVPVRCAHSQGQSVIRSERRRRARNRLSGHTLALRVG